MEELQEMEQLIEEFKSSHYTEEVEGE